MPPCCSSFPTLLSPPNGASSDAVCLLWNLTVIFCLSCIASFVLSSRGRSCSFCHNSVKAPWGKESAFTCFFEPTQFGAWWLRHRMYSVFPSPYLLSLFPCLTLIPCNCQGHVTSMPPPIPAQLTLQTLKFPRKARICYLRIWWLLKTWPPSSLRRNELDWPLLRGSYLYRDVVLENYGDVPSLW